ncbi:MAG TPA: ribosome-binding factor A [Opitutaceae bacterium]
MSNRIVRINELVQREISDILRRRYSAEAVAVTVTEVRIAPDLRDGRVFVAIVGEEEFVQGRFRWLRSIAPQLREELAKRIVIKFLPRLTYLLDTTAGRAAKIHKALNDLEAHAAAPPPQGEGDVLS